ncbi:MAG TPA: hypothetical protein VGI39_01385 [Polyangiaceae bacterium]
MKRKAAPRTLEELYPNSRARAVAWDAVDALSVSEPMSVYLDTFDEAYTKAGGKSPWRHA